MIPNTQKRGNVYYFRRKVPVDLVAHYEKPVILRSLGTTDYETAKARAAELTAQTNREFAALRGRKPDDWKAPARFCNWDIPLEHVEHDEARAEEYEVNRGYHKAVTTGLRTARETTDALLKASSLPTQDQLATSAFLASVQKESGTVSKPAREVTREDAPDALKNLRHVVPSWIRRNSPKRASIGYTWKAIELFEDAVGIVPLQRLTRAHGAKFVAYLLDSDARGFGAKTAGNHAASIISLINVAERDGIIDRNPLDLTFDKTVGAKSREPWTEDELERIYGSALFSGRMETVPTWVDVRPEDGRALLLLLLHTGARIGEIAQLRRGDFLTRDGIAAIRITGEAGTVKTAESERVVPLADHLLGDPWFAAWLSNITDGTRSDALALASLGGRKRGPADTASKWFKEFREYAALPPGRLHGSHKFRHWIRSAMAAKDVGVETADAITGHAAEGSSGRVSYTLITLPVMLAALNRLTYPSISRP